jgi:hypothetical protein
MLLAATGACGAPSASVDPAHAPPQALSAHDHNELLTDVQHLVGEAAALHAAERYGDAEGAWVNAWSLFSRHHLPIIQSADPTGAIAIEYEFGRLRAALRERRAGPKPVARALDARLEQHRRQPTLPTAADP